MTNIAHILEAARIILRQGVEMLQTVSDGDYTRPVPVAFGASLGGHYRHCLDHFTSLLGALDSAEVDYDHRERDPRIERDRSFALEVTRGLLECLEGIAPECVEAPVAARCQVVYDHEASPVTASSLGRELVYVIAHAIHHYALMAIMARLMNVGLPPHFGVAPSTVAYQARNPGRYSLDSQERQSCEA